MTDIKNSDKLEFKPKFVERYSRLTDFDEFKKISLTYLRRSIRVNTLKTTPEEIQKRLSKNWTLTPIPSKSLLPKVLYWMMNG